MIAKTRAKNPVGYILLIGVILVAWVTVFHPDWIIAGIPKASAQSIPADKSDMQCMSNETVGRCADKCPNPTDTLQGFDKQTGTAVCTAAPAGCPYADAVPLGPQCDKLGIEQAQIASQSEPTSSELESVSGK